MRASFSEFIADPSFPCVMAKSVMNNGFLSHHFINESEPSLVAEEILSEMESFVDHYRAHSKTLSSFVISFQDPELFQFGKFEKFFWKLLRELDGRDKTSHESDRRVSNDPESAHFSFSLNGEAFFMLVLHPQSPRMARQFSFPTIVFNAHQQFEDLREKGVFHKVRDLIRKRDIALQGFINPMVKDHGTVSEVFQYTGKNYPSQSKCPFHRALALFKHISPV